MGFFLTIIYIGIIYIRPQEFVEGWKNLPILQYVAGFCMAAVFLEGGFTSDKFRRSAVNWLVLAFWGSLVLSQLGNFWFGGAIFALQDFTRVAVCYFLVVLTVDTWPRIRVLCWVLVLLSTFLASQAIVQYYTGEGLVGGEAYERHVGGGEVVLQARGIGIFEDPNDLALNIISFLPFVLPAFHKGLMSRTWFTSIFFLIPMVTGLIYTRSRGGILGLAAVGWFYLKKRAGMVASIGGLILLMSLLLAIPRMESLDAGEASARSRLDHWAYGLGLLKRNPLFGSGYLQFTADYHHTAHNSFILVVAEEGLIGAFIWVAMFFATFRDLKLLREEVRGPPYMEEVVDTLTAALFGWHVSAFFLSQSYKYISFILMALVVSVQHALAREDIELERRWGLRENSTVMGLTIGGVIFMHILVMVLWNLPQ